MNYKGIAIVSIILTTMTFAISSCHKKNTQFDYNQAVETVHDYVEAQQMTNLLLQTYFKAIHDSLLLVDGTSTIDGATVTLTSQPASITFEYYGGAVDDGYGHIRSGKYHATTTSDFTMPSASIEFEFNNFSYDGDLVESKEFTLVNSDTFSDLIFELTADEIKRTYGDTTGTITYDMQQVIWLTKDPSSQYYTENDFFEVYGDMSGIARNNKSFNSSTPDSERLLQKFSCSWLVSGTSNIELPEFIHNATVSFFNNGQCLNKFSITTNGVLFEKAYDVNYY